ncbi:MAG: hypothetical protein NTX03_13175 [Bacteroidetes bacterium]|nr:hypothetical protein [Bacteroidota bacterium]
MNSTKTNLILALLVLIIGLEAWEIKDLMNCCTQDTNKVCKGDSTVPPVDDKSLWPCRNTNRYNIPADSNRGGKEITAGEAEGMIRNYKDGTVGLQPHDFKSCYISKQAIDQIFRNNQEANCLLIEMCKEEGTQDKTLIFTGKKTEHYKIITLPEGTQHSDIFYSTHYCPPRCGQ